MVMALLIALAQSYGISGYLCLDDVIIATRGNERSYLVFYCYFLICEKVAIRIDV
jgi:hypothetical protein